MNFSKEGLDFLFENRLMDSKPWFIEHRDIYEEKVLEPMRELVEALAPTINEIDDRMICEPKIGKSISRIYRDTRFTHDKSIFREKIWCVFLRDKKLYDGLPAFFVEVTPDGFSYGCGYYKASTASMERFRELILNDDRDYRAARKAVEKSEVFNLYAEKFKRTKFPNESEKKREWLDMKNIGAICYSNDFELLFSDRLADKIAKDFLSLKPFYKFLMKVETSK
ncbi:MAG: DUF2461 domain-containing protein [Ruminococcaceae bacterium]|nr:DUF2461 domain-containing protein [Oscillospiraceae bacterium]